MERENQLDNHDARPTTCSGSAVDYEMVREFFDDSERLIAFASDVTKQNTQTCQSNRIEADARMNDLRTFFNTHIADHCFDASEWNKGDSPVVRVTQYLELAQSEVRKITCGGK